MKGFEDGPGSVEQGEGDIQIVLNDKSTVNGIVVTYLIVFPAFKCAG